MNPCALVDCNDLVTCALQANHPAARRPAEPAASPPQKAAARVAEPAAAAAAAAPGRKLGIQDAGPPPPPSAPPVVPSSYAPQRTLPVPEVPEAAPQETAAEVTDAMSEAAAMIVSSGAEGLKAAKTICSVVSNVLKAPKEAKYRQLSWYDTRETFVKELYSIHRSINLLTDLRLWSVCRLSTYRDGAVLPFEWLLSTLGYACCFLFTGFCLVLRFQASKSRV